MKGGVWPLMAWWALGTSAWAASGAPPVAPASMAQVAQAAQAVPASTATEATIESARETVRSTTVWLARGVDSWFGDKPFEQGGQVSNGRISLSFLERQGDATDWTLRFNARFRMPNVERAGYLFVGRDNTREVVTDKPGTVTRQQRLVAETPADSQFFAGIGITALDSIDFRLGFRGGLKPYAQARYRKPWQLGPRGLLEFRETIFWTIDDHIGSTTALSYEHAISPVLAARWVSAATITQQVKKFEWSSNLGVYRLIGQKRVLSGEALFSGLQGSGVGVSEYGLQARWEQPIFHDRLTGSVVIGHFWLRPTAADDRRKAWALGGTVAMGF